MQAGVKLPREFLLPAPFVERLREYQRSVVTSAAEVDGTSLTDYWVRESALVAVEFLVDRVRVEAAQGFYVPPSAHNYRTKVGAQVRRFYKHAVLAADRVLGGSQEHALASSIPADMAYDYVMRGDVAIDYGGNPYRFNHAALKPLFRTSRELRRRWFLRDVYFAHEGIIMSAYHHAVFSHFLPEKASTYLEIGAGNGNLLSFFRRYNGLKAVVVELPKTTLHAAAYLQSIFPEAVLVLPNEIPSSLTAEFLRQSDVVFLHPEQASRLPDGYFDLTTNVHSMQEMTQPQIARYFELVQRVARPGGLWCNANRVEKVPGDHDRPTRAAEFPYDRGNKVLVDEIDRFMRLCQRDGVWMRIETVLSR